jgi:sortase A
MTKVNGSWRRVERVFLIFGVVLVSTYTIARFHSSISSRLAVESFKRSQATAIPGVHGTEAPRSSGAVDFSIWSSKRIQAYQESLISKRELPEAILRIPNLRIEVPVYEGTDDLTLNRGVGRILETAKIGEPGNIGIAGHRDGFFRGLKDIVPGERMELLTAENSTQYVVEQIEIVQPEDVRVLAERGAPSLTLVTCYPFYFVGDAPQRFIVHARAVPTHQQVSQVQ